MNAKPSAPWKLNTERDGRGNLPVSPRAYFRKPQAQPLNLSDRRPPTYRNEEDENRNLPHHPRPTMKERTEMLMLKAAPSAAETFPAVGGHKVNPLDMWTLFPGISGKTLVPSFREAIVVAEVAPTWCDECGREVTPVPLSSASEGWYMPCHERECGGCYRHPSRWEMCNNCDNCDECCSCPTCFNCDEKQDDVCSDCNYCRQCCKCLECTYCGSYTDNKCEDCNFCGSCCECFRNGSQSFAPTGDAPWIVRGDALPDSASFDVSRELSREAETLGLDPAQVMSDFYLCDWVAAKIAQGFPYGTGSKNGTANAHALRKSAQVLQKHLVAKCAPIFEDYVFAAIGGEVRHHRNVRGSIPAGRETCWDYWYAMGEEGDRETLTQDCVNLFSDGTWGSSYGGPRWATIATVLLQRFSGMLDDRTFVDRVFTLQHNGGSLLNKISWPVRNDSYGGVHSMIEIGNAHAADIPNFSVLLRYASADTAGMIREVVTSFSFLLSAAEKLTLSLAVSDGAE